MSHKPPLIPPSAATHTATPHENDVLCGRGGTINAHPGNEQYRHFVDRKKRVYLTVRFLIDVLNSALACLSINATTETSSAPWRGQRGIQ